MPTYEYQCRKCGHRFEKFQNITARPLTKCPECKGPVRRLVSGGAGLIFRGSGFHATDYRSEGYKKKARSERTPPKSSSESGGCGGGGCGACGTPGGK